MKFSTLTAAAALGSFLAMGTTAPAEEKEESPMIRTYTKEGNTWGEYTELDYRIVSARTALTVCEIRNGNLEDKIGKLGYHINRLAHAAADSRACEVWDLATTAATTEQILECDETAEHDIDATVQCINEKRTTIAPSSPRTAPKPEENPTPDENLAIIVEKLIAKLNECTDNAMKTAEKMRKMQDIHREIEALRRDICTRRRNEQIRFEKNLVPPIEEAIERAYKIPQPSSD